MNSLESKVVTATKWSALTEIASKLISPIAGMILARLLTPEAYGAVATTTIIISFAELFTDAGFQKYIIQHDFADDDDRDKSINVAFWTNLVMSLIIWGVIIVFRYPIARIVGSPGLETAIVVACAAIPIAAFSSIQNAIYKRNLNFRVPFIVRMIGLGITFFITIPLAFGLRSYWALIISKIIQGLVAAFVLTLYSNWKPTLYYSFKRFKEMFGFCSWVSAKTILDWMNQNVALFLVSTKFDQHTLGIYKTSLTKADKSLSVISSPVLPLLLPTFSKLKNDTHQLIETILKMQKHLSVIILPFGCLFFLYRDIIIRIYLGNQWIEAADLIGIWVLMRAFSILINHFCGRTYIAIGKPKVSTLISFLYTIVLIPLIIISSNYGPRILFLFHTLSRLWLIAINLIAIYLLIRLSPLRIFRNILPELIGCGLMVAIAYILSTIYSTTFGQLGSMLFCLSIYFVFLFTIKSERVIINKIWQNTANSIVRKIRCMN